MRSKDLFAWIRERHSIWTKRQAGKPKPWTKDPILQSYRFCNVFRELDTVTVWIRENIREPFADNPNLWLMLAIARRINWPDTLAELIADKRVWPIKKYNPEALRLALDDRTARKEQVYTGAYMITAGREIGVTKSRNTAYDSIGQLWEARAYISAKLRSGTLAQGFAAVQGRGFAWGPFMTAQLIADLKFCPGWLAGAHIDEAAFGGDWWTWAHVGPGSSRGMMRLLNRETISVNMPQAEFAGHLRTLQSDIDKMAAKAGLPRISAQDLQNVCCEMDKFERVRLGQGRPRSLYPGKA